MTTSDGHGVAVVLTTGLSHTAGGPFFSVSGLASALTSFTGWHSQVVGSYCDAESWPHDRGQWEGCGLLARPHTGLASARWIARACMGVLDSASRSGRPTLMHVSGLWDAASVAGRIVAGQRGTPYVISPRGMLEPWALRSKAAKKQVALVLWQRHLLSGAAMLHATSRQECDSIRAAGFRNPVCIVPNGVSPPAATADPEDDRHARRSRRCVFLSRIHPKKGLPLLIRAWARVRPVEWTLEIAGYPENHAHDADVRRLVDELALGSVHFVGERQGEHKWAFLRQADLFVLPSYSENFGIVVAEALACGVPVIATTGTPWRVLSECGFGWWVDPSEQALTAALSQALSEPPEALSARGERGRAYAAKHFGWPQLASRIADAYSWAAGHGPPTADIVFD